MAIDALHEPSAVAGLHLVVAHQQTHHRLLTARLRSSLSTNRLGTEASGDREMDSAGRGTGAEATTRQHKSEEAQQAEQAAGRRARMAPSPRRPESPT